MEIDLVDLAKKVFKETPKPPKNYQLSFDAYGLKEMYEMLLTFLVEGLKTKWGVDGKINMNNLSNDDLQLIDNYMKSVGIKVNLDILTKENYELIKNIMIPYDKYIIKNNTKLCEMKYALKCGDLYHVISFDLI
jgi:hypothetical protein